MLFAPVAPGHVPNKTEKVLHVFAAASLKNAFEAIGKRFEAENPGVKLEFQFAGSQQLAAQINQGADVDLFASASQKNLDQIAYDPQSRRVFALNSLVVVTSKVHPALRSFKDLNRVTNLVIAGRAVPAGAYAHQALHNASAKFGVAWVRQIEGHVVSEEQDVRAVLAKVLLGEADAGIVYLSDAVSAHGALAAVPIPTEFQPRIAYPSAILKTSHLAHDATHFMHLVLSPEGQAILKEQGFGSPIREARQLTISWNHNVRILPVPFKSQKEVIVVAVGPNGKSQKYTGIPLGSLLAGVKTAKSVTLVGADEYQRTVTITPDLLRSGIVTIAKDGYAQAILPGLKPNYWVGWLTRIIFRP